MKILKYSCDTSSPPPLVVKKSVLLSAAEELVSWWLLADGEKTNAHLAAKPCNDFATCKTS